MKKNKNSENWNMDLKLKIYFQTKNQEFQNYV